MDVWHATRTAAGRTGVARSTRSGTTALRGWAYWFMLLAGTSNVVMQLSMQPVGHGVKDSRVDEGNLFLNPSRRRRTTLGYIAVAILGDAGQRAAYRRATNRSHARVRSHRAAVGPRISLHPQPA